MSFADLVARTWRKHVLFAAHLELGYQCNLDCHFCYNDRARQGPTLSIDEWLGVLDALADMQVFTVTLSGGEPMVNPGFFAIGAHARARGFVVRVKTNGQTLRDDVVERLVGEVAPYLVEVSLHGATASTHDRQTRVAGSFARLMENLSGARERVRMQLNVPLTLWNEHELEAMLDLGRQLGVPVRVDPEVTPRDDGDRGPLAIAPSPAGLRRWARALPAVVTSPPASVDSDAEKHCGAGSASLLIDPFGDVMPCVQWRKRIGNVRHAPLAELWRSPALDEVRSTLVAVRRDLGPCVDHCPGIALALTGDARGETPQEAGRRAARALPVLQ